MNPNTKEHLSCRRQLEGTFDYQQHSYTTTWQSCTKPPRSLPMANCLSKRRNSMHTYSQFFSKGCCLRHIENSCITCATKKGALDFRIGGQSRVDHTAMYIRQDSVGSKERSFCVFFTSKKHRLISFE